MTWTVPLEVMNMTARRHGDAPLHTQPVIAGYDGTRVILAMDVDHAEFLAKLLANVGVAPKHAQELEWLFTVDKDTQDTWLHAMVDLIASAATVKGAPVPVTALPIGATR